jgi:hypothetical protein
MQGARLPRRHRLLVITAVVVLAIAAIGTAGYFALRPAEHQQATTTTTSHEPHLADLSGTWTGTYTCLQGLTGMELVITQHGSTAIEAVFSFYADPSNPSVPSGTFSMDGTFHDADRTVSLNGTQWLNKPSGYRMIDLAGTVSADLTTISGQVLNPPCSTFTVRRLGIDQ